jgi:UDP-N-acetylmuramoyl-L-alanyl-D-glutamate--2,6-diaminopimelate ligase
MADSAAPGHGISLRELFPDAEILGAEDVRVRSCAVDSRHCREGDLFVAVRGSRVDGCEYVPQAISAGAAAVLSDRPLPDCPVPVCLVNEINDACGRLCQALAGNPSRRMKVIGITGTNGKTTTSYLVASILNAAGYQSGIVGTLGYFDGAEVTRARWTTPPAHVLAPTLARLEANGCTHAAIEVSSHALALGRIAGVELDAACVTNVSHDHLDFHHSHSNYRRAKARLFEHLAPEGFAIVNADDPVALAYLDRVDGPCLTVGLDSPAELSAAPLERCRSEQTFLLSMGDEAIPVRTPLIGRHNIYNCLMAAAVGFTYGIDLHTIVRGLEAIDRLPGRLERLECGQPFGVFVDYAHTPDALSGVLGTLREVTDGRLICVFGAGGDRDRSKRPWMGQAVDRAADLAVVTSDNPRSEEPREIMAEIMQGIRRPERVQAIVDRAEAIHFALAQARAGDCVLIAGKGHEDYQIIGKQVYEFDDREVACRWLYESAERPLGYRASA